MIIFVRCTNKVASFQPIQFWRQLTVEKQRANSESKITKITKIYVTLIFWRKQQQLLLSLTRKITTLQSERITNFTCCSTYFCLNKQMRSICSGSRSCRSHLPADTLQKCPLNMPTCLRKLVTTHKYLMKNIVSGPLRQLICRLATRELEKPVWGYCCKSNLLWINNRPGRYRRVIRFGYFSIFYIVLFRNSCFWILKYAVRFWRGKKNTHTHSSKWTWK